MGKSGTLDVPARSHPPRQQPRTFWRLFMLSTLLVGGKILTGFAPWTPWMAGVVPMTERCPQVEPIFPSTSKELDDMYDYLASDQLKSKSITRLSGAVQIPTMSFDDLGAVGEDPRWNTFYDFAAYLKETFPLVHATLELEMVNTHGLAYTWAGSNSSLKPTLLMAHQDVVPVPESTIPSWTHPPFSGFYDGKYIWGRGASDCKNILIGILEAIESLVSAGFEPARTIIVPFGFDEEAASCPQQVHEITIH
jgi:Gly-Xaa carboxypeptidase